MNHSIRHSQLVALTIFLSLLIGVGLWPRLTSDAADANGFKKLLDTRAQLAPRASKTYRLPASAQRTSSLLVALPMPSRLGAQDGVTITLRDAKGIIADKTLHQGDADLYTLFRAGAETEIVISSNAGVPVEHAVTVLEWPESKTDTATTEAEPNDSWQAANEIQPGQIVWASADDKPYVAALDEAAAKRGTVPYAQQPELTADRLPAGGVDWFKFTYDGAQPRLVHFELELLERDNIPVDVSVFTIENGQPKVYERGLDPVTPPHEVQALPGNKFTTRVITKGTYYVRVDANHPAYQLRTALYDVPPYEQPAQAVRAGMDYLVSAGDSWHANTPRHGGLVTRASSNHFETQLCIACHATHFTTRAELTAQRNGYAVNKQASLEFLTERLANNPLPFYGHPEAYWTRVISASANVMSRLAALVTEYDQQNNGARRLQLLKGVGGYLKIYYKGRTELPNDESNGNTPLVSTYEVAWYSWRVFDELFKATNLAEYQQYRDQIRQLLNQDKIKNNVDLCYQTIALAEIDRAEYADKIKRNAERILSLQRPDGQWSMLFAPDSPAVEFQTFHCLYALARAGYAPEQPQIAKSLKFLLARQQDFGGWFDPKQSYENFRTPFRETQFAVMALSEFYKNNREERPRLPKFDRLDNRDPLLRLAQLDSLWSRATPSTSSFAAPSERPRGNEKQYEKPRERLSGDLTASLASEEPMVRMAAAATLGRLGLRDDVASLIRLLGDRSKLVQIAAAQALRRIAVKSAVAPIRNPGLFRSSPPPVSAPTDYILTALNSSDERTRWAATRVFAQHFAYLANQTQLADRLLAMLADSSISVRMQATKSLVQWFYWTKDEALKWRIVDAFIARLAVPEHVWVRRNLREGLYSLADENVRYLNNNWIGQLAQKEDRDRATRALHATSQQMAERIARALETGNELQREGLLRGLTEFHLRSGGYTNAGRYTRIGNDIETVIFYPAGAPAMERALAPLLNATDAARRQQAVLAAYTLRDNTLTKLPLLVMQRLNDDDPSVRAVSNEFYRALPLKVVAENRQMAVTVLRELLSSKHAAAQIAALERIRTLGEDFARSEKFDAEVRNFVLRSSGGNNAVVAAALRSLTEFPHLANAPEVQQRITAALQSTDDNLSRAGVQLVLLKPELRGLPLIAAALDEIFKTTTATKRRLILDLINTDTPIDNDLRFINLLAESLEDPDENVRAAALNAVRRVKTLPTNAAIRASLAKLTKDPNQRLQGLAIAIYQGQDGGVALDLAAKADKLLDYGFFVQRVMPLLAAKGADGNACVTCHDTHTIFRLVGSAADGRFNETQLRENYRSALKVVDLANPENSLLIRKPTGDASQEGLIGSKKTPHGGGQRWSGLNDPAVQTVLEWINGAKASASAK